MCSPTRATAARRRTTSTAVQSIPASSSRRRRQARGGSSSGWKASRAKTSAPRSHAFAVEVRLQAERQVLAAEEAAGGRGARQRICGQDHRRTRPRGALFGPALPVGENQTGPIGSVFLTQMLHRGKLFGGRSVIADRVECHDQFAG